MRAYSGQLLATLSPLWLSAWPDPPQGLFILLSRLRHIPTLPGALVLERESTAVTLPARLLPSPGEGSLFLTPPHLSFSALLVMP